MAALSSCPGALRRLCGLMGQRSKVLAAAAGIDDEGQELVGGWAVLLLCLFVVYSCIGGSEHVAG